MKINPDTLQVEDDEERAERQRKTGVLGNGLMVECRPTEDPDVVEVKHRAICLTRPYSACQSCPHSRFLLIFKADPTERYEQVACPRWLNPTSRIEGSPPDTYVMTEVACCEDKSFDFCRSCPSKEKLKDYGVDKTRPGWYGRWARLRKEELE